MLEALTKFFTLSVLIRIMTCLCDGLLVVILIFSLGLFLPLIIFWTCSIFLFWKLGKAFLIFKVSLATFNVFKLDNAWA